VEGISAVVVIVVVDGSILVGLVLVYLMGDGAKLTCLITGGNVAGGGGRLGGIISVFVSLLVISTFVSIVDVVVVLVSFKSMFSTSVDIVLFVIGVGGDNGLKKKKR